MESVSDYGEMEDPLAEEADRVRDMLRCIEDAVNALPGDGYMVHRFTPEWLEQLQLMDSGQLVVEMTRLLYNIGAWNISRLWRTTRLRLSPVGTLLTYNVINRVVGNESDDPVLSQILREDAEEIGKLFLKKVFFQLYRIIT